MRERPIIFSAPMVRALLDGRKTQTRRVVRICDDPITQADHEAGRRQRGIPTDAKNVRWLGYLKCDAPPGSYTVSARVDCPYGDPGDRLWVKETHAQFAVGNRSGISPQCVAYRATCDADGGFEYANNGDEVMRLKVTKWTPAIYMPRWASRILLEITDRRAERLQDISTLDAMGAPARTRERLERRVLHAHRRGPACARGTRRASRRRRRSQLQGMRRPGAERLDVLRAMLRGAGTGAVPGMSITPASLESLTTGELIEEGICVRRLGLGIGHWLVEGPIESFRARSAKRAWVYVRQIRRTLAREYVASGFVARIVDGRLTRITCTRCGRSIDLAIRKRIASPNYVLYLLQWRDRHPADGACS